MILIKILLITIIVNGIRTEKNVNGNITKYILEGNKILKKILPNNDEIRYIYDNEEVIGILHNSEYYHFEKNAQSDIINLLDDEFNIVANYEYDSWGQILSVKDNVGIEIDDINHVAFINPLRYRSYYYDNETNLYYLNSRYYNPEWKRFINADGIIGSNQDILGYNLYVYCSNNNVNYEDPERNSILGNLWYNIFGKKDSFTVANNSPVGSTPTLDKIGLVSPTKNLTKQKITSKFGKRIDPKTGQQNTMHNGIDIGGKTNSSIYAVTSGNVTSGYNDIMENYIKINTDDFTYVYMHLNKINVSKGYVNIGTEIGGMGTTGKSTGTHLHFAIWDNKTKRYIDPQNLLHIKGK